MKNSIYNLMEIVKQKYGRDVLITIHFQNDTVYGEFVPRHVEGFKKKIISSITPELEFEHVAGRMLEKIAGNQV